MDNTTDDEDGTISPDGETHVEYVIARYVRIVGFSAWMILGTFGNASAFIVFARGDFSGSSTGFLFRVLACVDLLNIYISVLPKLVGTLLDQNVYNMHVLLCKGVKFATYDFAATSAWVLVVITLERAIAIYRPFHAKEICSLTVVRSASVAVIVFLGGLYGHMIWGYVLSDGACVPREGYSQFVEDIFMSVDMAVFSIAPFSIMIISNILIGIKLLQHDKQRSSSTSKNVQHSRSVTKMLLILNSMFFMTTSPLMLLMVFKPDLMYLPDLQERAQYWLVLIVFETLNYANNALNFYMYCLSGSHFRERFIQTFRQICCRSSRDESNASSHTSNSATRARNASNPQ
jgi:hypothetical protein